MNVATDTDQGAADSKRSRFYEAAEPLFVRFGYRKTTIEEICKAAGASKRTFYELFDDKADLFGHLILHVSETEIERWRRDLPDGLDPRGRIVSYIELYAGALATRPVMRIMFSEDMSAVFGRVLDEALQSPIMAILGEIVEEGIACGQFRPMRTEAAIWIVSSILDTMYFLMPGWGSVKGASEDPALAEETRNFVLAGLGCSPSDVTETKEGHR